MKRIFIALKVEPGENLLMMISTLKSGLSNDLIRWTNTDNIHITLAFLGDTEEQIVKVVSSMLDEKCTGSGKFELMLKGSGVFRNLSVPRIIWAGIDPSEELMHLNGLIMNVMKELNIKMEDRPFRPHLTLCRIKHLYNEEKLKSLIDRFQNFEIQNVPVNEVILYESILLQSGPIYKPLAKFNLS